MSSDVEAAKSMTETEPQLRDPVLDIAESHHNAIILSWARKEKPSRWLTEGTKT